MESSPDYRSIVLSPPFTFLIGPTHTKLTIQSALARHVSQPLDHLMNNGVTRESKHRIALVEDEDPETFVAFCEYAYTADYTVPDVPVSGFGNSGGGGGGGGGGDDDDLPGYRGDGRDFRSPGTASPAGIGSPVSLRFAHAYRRGSYSDVPPPVPSPPPPAPSPGRENEGDAGRAFEGNNNNDNTDAPAAAAAAADDNEHDGYIRNQTEPGEPSAYQRMNMSTDEDGEEKEDNTIRGRRRRRKQQNITPPWSPPEKDPNKSSGNNPFRGTGAATMIDTSASHWEQAVASTDDDDGGGNNETGDPRQRHKSKRAERKKTTELSLWDEFVSLNYYYYNHINNVNTRGNRRRPPHGDDGDDDNNNKNHKEDNIPYLVFHAKVYVFAIRYLIPALAQLCLKKLHRGLLNLSFPGPSPKSDFYYDEFDDEERDRAMRTTALARAKAKAKMILALLHFTYTRTTRLEPVVVQQVASGLASGTPETRLRENELRKLVVHYAACKIKDLAEYCPPAPEESGSGGGGGVVSDEKKDTTTAGSSKKNNTNAWDWGVSRGGLRGLMDNTTELASDLVYRMM